MKQLTIILAFIGLLSTVSVNGQSIDSECDSIYNSVEVLAQYDKGANGLMDFFMTDLAPTLSECFERDSILSASMFLTLMIDKQGKVNDVDFHEIHTTESCKEKLNKKIIGMSGWIAGQQGGVPVCSRFVWPIRCINWK